MGSILQSSTVYYALQYLMPDWVSLTYQLIIRPQSLIKLNPHGNPIRKPLGFKLKAQLLHLNQNYFSVPYFHNTVLRISSSVPSLLQLRHNESSTTAPLLISHCIATYHTWYLTLCLDPCRLKTTGYFFQWLIATLISSSECNIASKDVYKYLRITLQPFQPLCGLIICTYWNFMTKVLSNIKGFLISTNFSRNRLLWCYTGNRYCNTLSPTMVPFFQNAQRLSTASSTGSLSRNCCSDHCMSNLAG